MRIYLGIKELSQGNNPWLFLDLYIKICYNIYKKKYKKEKIYERFIYWRPPFL